MKYCKYCASPVEEHEDVCPRCRATTTPPPQMTPYCPRCGTPVQGNELLCLRCGTPLYNGEAYPMSAVPANKPSLSLILGLIGIVTAWLFVLVGHAVSIAGIVYGIGEYKKTAKAEGLVVSIIGECCAVLTSFLGALIWFL